MAEAVDHKSGVIKTNDGIELTYDQFGDPSSLKILFLPGWCQTAIQWRKQYDELKRDFHITTFDYRGHGASQKTDRGYRISRFAADLNDVLAHLELKDITLVGHSMGCSVIWSYWDIFASERHRIKSLVLVDQSSCMMPRSEWSEEMAKEVGTAFTQQSLDQFITGLRGDARAVMSQFVPAMFTDKTSAEDVDWVLERNLMVDPKNAATLLLDHGKNDWRDVIETITVPTLTIAGTGSICPVTALEWITARITSAHLVVFDKEDGGSHFMFWENSIKFNTLLRRFVGKGDIST